MKPCKVCKDKTDNVFNIDFEAIPICEECATSIFFQQANWYVRWHQQEQDKEELDKLLKQRESLKKAEANIPDEIIFGRHVDKAEEFKKRIDKGIEIPIHTINQQYDSKEDV